MEFLAGGQGAVAGQEPAEVALHDLHGAIGPAEALRAVAGEAVRREPMAEGLLDIDRLVALGEDAQAELGVLADAPLGPAAQLVEERAADERHGAVLDDGVRLVAQDHAEVEEAGTFPVGRFLEEALSAVAMVLRALHDADLRVGEMGCRGLEPIGAHDVVAVDHADDLGRRIASAEG